MRLVTNEDMAVVDCHNVDVNPYCQIIERGMNISCHECKRRNLWEKFWRQDQKGKSIK